MLSARSFQHFGPSPQSGEPASCFVPRPASPDGVSRGGFFVAGQLGARQLTSSSQQFVTTKVADSDVGRRVAVILRNQRFSRLQFGSGSVVTSCVLVSCRSGVPGTAGATWLKKWSHCLNFGWYAHHLLPPATSAVSLDALIGKQRRSSLVVSRLARETSRTVSS